MCLLWLLLFALLACSPPKPSRPVAHPSGDRPAVAAFAVEPVAWDPPTRLPAPIRRLAPPCVELETEQRWCWGSQTRSAILVPTEATLPEQPVDRDLSGVAEPEWFAGLGVQAYASFACGLSGDGRVRCARRRGGPRERQPLAPHTEGWIDGITDAVELVVGAEWACVRHGTGRVSCFGQLHSPQGPRLVASVPSTHLDGWLPPTDLGFAGVTALATGYGGVGLCLARTDELTCAGSGDAQGVPVPDLPPVIQAWSDGTTGCGLAADRRLWCWSDAASDPALAGDGVVALGDGGLLLDSQGRLGRVRWGRALWTETVAWPDPPPSLELRGDEAAGCAFAPDGPARCWGDLPGDGLPKDVGEMVVDPLCWLDAAGRPGCAEPNLLPSTVRKGSVLDAMPQEGFVGMHIETGRRLVLTAPDQIWACDLDEGHCGGSRWEGPPIAAASSQVRLAAGAGWLWKDALRTPPLDRLGRGGALIDRDGGVHLVSGSARYLRKAQWTTLAVQGGQPGSGWRADPPTQTPVPRPREAVLDWPPDPLPAALVRLDGPCAFTASGEAWCRGDGVGRSALSRQPGLDGASAILRIGFDCALVDGDIRCGGASSHGELPKLQDADEGLVLTDDGRVLDVFREASGQLRLVATELSAPGAVELATLSHRAPTRAAVRLPDGTVTVVGGGRFPPLEGATAIAASSRRVYAIDEEGQVLQALPPVEARFDRAARPARSGPVEGVAEAVELVATEHYGCALTARGRVLCFGDLYDELEPRLPGLPPRSRLEAESPAVDLGLTGVRDLSVTALGIALLTEDGIMASGAPDLGDAIPVPIRGLPPLHAAGIERGDGCGIDDGGGVWCWPAGEAPGPLGHRAVAMSAAPEPIWLSSEGDVWTLDGGAPVIALDGFWPEPPAEVRIRGGEARGCAFVPGDAPRCWGDAPEVDGRILDLWGACWLRRDHQLRCDPTEGAQTLATIPFVDEEGTSVARPTRIDALGPGLGVMPSLIVGGRAFGWGNDDAYRALPRPAEGAIRQVHGEHVLMEDGTLFWMGREQLRGVARLLDSEGLAARTEAGRLYGVASGLWWSQQHWVRW